MNPNNLKTIFDKINVDENLKQKVIEESKNLNYKNKKYKRIYTKAALAAAIAIVFTVTTAFVIPNIISYFNGSELRYESDKPILEALNKNIGLSCEDNGIIIILDSLSMDESFINIFYTVKSSTPIKQNDETHLAAWFAKPFLTIKADSHEMGYGNNDSSEAYFESDKVLKVMERYSVLSIDLPQTIQIELYTDRIFDIEGNWRITTKIQQLERSKKSLSIAPDKAITFHIGKDVYNIIVDKISISPLGNQIVISQKDLKVSHLWEDDSEDDRVIDMMNFTLLDPKENVLDILGANLRGAEEDGSATNSFEFIKADANMAYVTLVPIKQISDEMRQREIIFSNEGMDMYPMLFKVSSKGTVVVDKVEILNNAVKITYKKDGYVFDNPGFTFFDNTSERINYSFQSDVSVNRQEGIYTQTLTLVQHLSGKQTELDLSKIAKVGIWEDDEVEFLYDQQVRFDLR